jgi:hypothetical protein
MNPNQASKIIDQWDKREGDPSGRFWDLDTLLFDLGESLQDLRAIKTKRILIKIRAIEENLYKDLRSRGALGPYMIYPRGGKKIFVQPRIVIKRRILSW